MIVVIHQQRTNIDLLDFDDNDSDDDDDIMKKYKEFLSDPSPIIGYSCHSLTN